MIGRPEHPTFDEMRRDYFTKLIKLCKGEVTAMAEVSGLARASIYRALAEYGLNKARADAQAERKVFSGTGTTPD